MTTKKASLICVEEEEEEDCIEMEPSHPPSKFSYSIGSAPPPPQKTEFQSQNKKKLKSSAGNEIVQNANTPFGFVRSRSLFQSRSFRDEKPHGYRFQWFNKIDEMGIDLPKEHWSNKPKQSKQSKQSKQFWLAQRFNDSRAFIKSLFTSTGCSEKSSAIAANKAVNDKPMCQECQIQNKNDAKRNSFERFYDKPRRSCSVVTRRIDSDMVEDNRRRLSFTGVFQRHCTPKASSLSNTSSGSSSLSSSFSYSSSGSRDLQSFRRSSLGVNSEGGNLIEDAIAHCKQSQQRNGDDKALHDDDKNGSESASRVAGCGN